MTEPGPVPPADPQREVIPDVLPAEAVPPAPVDEEAVRRREFVRKLITLTPYAWVTPTLIAINVGVFAVMVASGVGIMDPKIEQLLSWGANYAPWTVNGQWWRLLTCTFIHIGILHLLLNMWALLTVGLMVERLVGNVGFLLLYLVSGICGSLASTMWNPVVVSAGASGAVFGVAGALLGFVLLRGDSIPMESLRQLRNSMIFFVGFNLVYGLTTEKIDQAAHVGGLVAGFLCGLALSQRLEPEAAGRRMFRNVIVGAVGAMAIAAGIFVIAQAGPVDDIHGALQHFAEVEKKTLDTYNALVTRSQNRQITDEEMVKVIERDILPPWRAEVESLASLKKIPPQRQEFMNLLLRYARTRQESWELIVQSVREQDAKKIEASNARAAEAERLIRELNAASQK